MNTTAVKQVLFVIGLSIILVALIAWWIEGKKAEPPILLDAETELPGPLTPEELEIAKPDITNTMNHIAVFNTSRGPIKIELFEDQMPITTGNFLTLAQSGFYNGTKFHRVIENFMIQGGDPNSKGTNVSNYGQGGPGHTIQDEFVAGPLLSNVRGTIAMANTGQPNSGGSQFFINTKDNTGLDFDKPPFESSHPVFGRVIEGMDIVDTISRVETGANDVPLEPIVIESIAIES